MKTERSAAYLCNASAIAIMVVMAGNAVAQDAVTSTRGATQLEAITITGEKVSRSLRNTASSVSAIDSETLEKDSDAASVADVIKSVPNVTFTSTVGAPIIRGQDTQGPNYGSTAFFGGTVPRATINLDGHYLNFYEYVYGGASIWDVDSIEVFRGPQTTSQGANAIAGAIMVNTKDPTFEPEAAYRAEVGSYKGKRASAMVSGPLGDSGLAGRVAVDYWGRDTFIDYVNTAFNKGDTDQNLRSFNGRAKLLWEPDEIPGLSAKLTYSHIQNNRPTWEAASSPYSNLDSTTTSMPSWKSRSDTGVFDISYDFENGVKVFNQSQISKMHVDRVAAPVTNGSATIDQTNYSNESRVTFGDEDSMFSGMAGVYLARTLSHDRLNIRGISDFHDRKTNVGVFSEVSYRPTDRWTITGGLRYQNDHIQRSGSSPYATGALDYDRTFDAWLPKLSVAYDLTQDLTVGGLVSRGYNPGGVNLSFAGKNYITFEPETSWNYELFARAELMDGRLNITTNVFYTDYRNSQRLLPDYLGTTQYGSIVVNADKAHSYGLEVGVDWMARDNLRIRAGAGLLKTEIGTFVDSLGNSYTGNEFGQAPGYMLSLGADWDVTEKLTVSGDIRFTDGYYSTDENQAIYAVDSYAVANASMSYAFNEKAELYAYVNNIFDKRAPTYLSTDRAVGGTVANMLEPRTFGVGIRGKF
ncbi:TonB-dependent receptor [Rhizobium sp. L1K21]|uniref:TonB-dependent receptor n=1 Tax=Rhizobium sp. L1K21 TaxID=2954933 RepID=UPI00209228DC|nr:TonB-dependent receptor [Rhizobium sp. L1K21]MCO6187563.1 TonB-dependent receptor [Rhizobium sp. L1K21]